VKRFSKLLNSQQELWELWETRSVFGGEFSKLCGKVGENGGLVFPTFPQSGSFHSSRTDHNCEAFLIPPQLNLVSLPRKGPLPASSWMGCKKPIFLTPSLRKRLFSTGAYWGAGNTSMLW
jgi:hypothetical protein